MAKFYPIGTILKHENVLLKVVEKGNCFCDGCYFASKSQEECNKIAACSNNTNGRITNVIFVRVPAKDSMVNNVEQVYRSLLERKAQLDEHDFDDIWEAVLDNLVLSNKSLALDIEDLANLEPEEFKKEALKLAKKEYSL